MSKTRFLFLAGMILAAAVSRLLPHPPNFAPIAAMALFGGACFRDKSLAFGVPLVGMILSDLAIDLQWIHLAWGTQPSSAVLHWGKVFVYAAFALSVGLGFWLQRRRTLVPIVGATLASSLLFFIVTNFGSWVVDANYPRTLAGLGECFAAGLEFWRQNWTLLGDVFYATVLFGSLALAEQWVPATRETVALQTT